MNKFEEEFRLNLVRHILKEADRIEKRTCFGNEPWKPGNPIPESAKTALSSAGFNKY